jgi:hypothetical protein
MFQYLRKMYEYIYYWYSYTFCKEKIVIPFDAREKIYDRDPDVLNSIINYYRYDKAGKKLY